MKLRQRLILTAACLMAIPQTAALAEQANPSMWGYSGLLNVPTADTLGGRRFYTGLRYFPLNSGLSGSAAVNLFDDFEAALVFGIPPANGFSALAASVKYRIMDQHKGQPVSLAIGASLLGLDTRNQASDIPGNQLYLMLSRGVDWNNARLFNLHGGFMGGLGSARLVAGLDVPISDIFRFEAEYLGSVNFDRQVFNFGAIVTPHPDISIELGLTQQPSTNFGDRDITLGVTYHGDWGKLLGQSEIKTPVAASSNTPTAVESPSPSASPASTRGNTRVRILDKERIIALEGAEVTLKQPETGISFSANTDINGEVFLPGIPTGKYQVKVFKEGWKAETRMVSIQPELNTFLEIPISGIAGSIYGALSGVQNNTDTLIELLDIAGKVIKRQTLEGLSYEIDAIPPGQYTLLFKQEGVERTRLNIQVKGDTRSQYDIRVMSGELPQATPSAVPSSTPEQPTAAASPSPEKTPVPVPAGQNAEIKGIIKNKAGEPLSSIRLELKNEELLVITLTKSDGTYAFRDIPKGVYRLGISAEGYASRAFQITINKPEVLKHDFTLERTP